MDKEGMRMRRLGALEGVDGQITAYYFPGNVIIVRDVQSQKRLLGGGIGSQYAIDGSSTSDKQENAELSLSLAPEEAFYLVQRESLVVVSQTSLLSPEELWQRLVQKNTSFPIKYRVYQYFKDRGYVVRTGINFGVDYCIYQSLPSLCHSEMCVTVVDAVSGSTRVGDSTALDSALLSQMSGIDTRDNGQLSWRHVSTLTRIMPNVMKLCIICYVVNDANHDEDTSNSVPESANSSKEAKSPYLSLFTNNCTAVDYSSFSCLDNLSVRPVTAQVRRFPALVETYQNIQSVQRKYQKYARAHKKVGVPMPKSLVSEQDVPSPLKVQTKTNRKRKQVDSTEHKSQVKQEIKKSPKDDKSVVEGVMLDMVREVCHRIRKETFLMSRAQTNISNNSHSSSSGGGGGVGEGGDRVIRTIKMREKPKYTVHSLSHMSHHPSNSCERQSYGVDSEQQSKEEAEDESNRSSKDSKQRKVNTRSTRIHKRQQSQLQIRSKTVSKASKGLLDVLLRDNLPK